MKRIASHIKSNVADQEIVEFLGQRLVIFQVRVFGGAHQAHLVFVGRTLDEKFETLMSIPPPSPLER